MTDTIRVLVVDDSPTVRQVLSDLLNESEGMEVVGTANDGHDALRKIDQLQPNVMTLDIQMPGMDGLEAIDAIISQTPIPIIVVSSLTQRSAPITLDALEHGAMDYVEKPEGQAALTALRGELARKVRQASTMDVERILRIRRERAKNRVAQKEVAVGASAAKPVGSASTIAAAVKPTSELAGKSKATARVRSMAFGLEQACIAIGISTGGPPALTTILPRIEPPTPPIVIVQHMPAQFTLPFAKRLDGICPLEVRQAEEGDVLQPNQVYLAPGGMHLELVRRGSRVLVKLQDGDPVSSHRPSVDVMMISAANAYRHRCLGVIMTGMGSDGVEGCRAIRNAGGTVLGQDAATSDVYGMNKAAFVQGYVDRQFGLTLLPELLRRHCDKLVAK